MSKRHDKSKRGSEYDGGIVDDYLAEKSALDAIREREYGAGMSNVPEHGGARPGDDDYAFNFGEDSQADLDFTKSAAAATAAAAAEAGLDMSGYLKSAHVQDDDLGDDDDLLAYGGASDEGLERFMRSIGFGAEEDELANAKSVKTKAHVERRGVTADGEVVEEVDIDSENGLDGDSYGPAIGVRSPLDGRFDLRTGRVGNALGEGTERPLLDLDGDYSALPSPDVLAAYPAEVQRKIIEWTDRDVRARRDNESLRQDIILREKIAQRKIIMFFAVLVVVVCIICAVATSILLRDAIYAVVFLLIPLVVVATTLMWLFGFGSPKR